MILDESLWQQFLEREWTGLKMHDLSTTPMASWRTVWEVNKTKKCMEKHTHTHTAQHIPTSLLPNTLR